MAILVSDKIDKGTITKQAYSNIYNIINNRSNIPDPVDSTSTRTMVHTNEPNFGRNFAGYPIIILFPVIASFTQVSSNGSKALVEWRIEIEVKSSDNIRGNENRGQEFLEAISDDIIETLNNTTNKMTLRTYGMGFINPNIADSDTLYDGDNKIYLNRFIIPFSKIIKVN